MDMQLLRSLQGITPEEQAILDGRLSMQSHFKKSYKYCKNRCDYISQFLHGFRVEIALLFSPRYDCFFSEKSTSPNRIAGLGLCKHRKRCAKRPLCPFPLKRTNVLLRARSASRTVWDDFCAPFLG